MNTVSNWAAVEPIYPEYRGEGRIPLALFLIAILILTLGAVKVPAQELITTQPATRPATQAADSGVEIVIDSSKAPELEEWCQTKLKLALEEWYPLIVSDLPSNGFVAPKKFTVTIDPNYRGVAATGGTRVVVSPNWIKSQNRRNGWNEAVGSVIHEEVHVVQQYGYGRRRGGTSNPVWLVEGIADYVRWFKYEPADHRPHPRATGRGGRPASYTDSYQTTATFLEFVAEKYDHEIVVQLNASLREGRYKAELWKLYTGKTVDELWTEFAETLRK